MVLSKFIKINKYLQHFEYDMHIAHIPPPHMKEPMLSLI